MPFPFLAIASLGLTALGVFQQYQAAQDARDAERENARLIEAENVEQARRMESENEARESSARARAAASGVNLTGTTGEYLSEMERENTRQENWLKRSGASRADSARRRGDAAYSSGLADAIGTAAGGFGQGFNWFGQ